MLSIKHLFLVTCIGFFACRLSASSSLGGLAGAYLRPPVGAVAVAMGGAQTASPDYLASWWNPAIIATSKTKKISLGTGYRSLGRLEGFSSLELRIQRLGLGFVVLYRGDPYIDGLVDADEYEIGPVSYNTVTSKIAFSYLVSRRLSLGASLGMYYQSLPAYDDNALDRTNEWSFAIGGIDLAAHYRLLDNLTFGVAVRHLNVVEDWQFAMGSLSSAETQMVPPTIVLGSRFSSELLGKPFFWNCDIIGYAISGELNSLSHMTAVLNNGIEWQMWESLYLRGGIGDVAFDSNIFDDRDRYSESFSLRVTAGFSVDLSGVKEGLRLNYGLSNSKIMAGANQQVDIVFYF
ncbi:MAG: hypothetical protein GF350_12445 [Chitinivibrionales bacterium]|nr:hypothetical protein [Chitinivibrionales bacterium]